MKVVIVGGAGFLGTVLARRLLATGKITVGGASPAVLDELYLLDVLPARPDLLSDARVNGIVGDVTGAGTAIGRADLVFHLAGVVSAAAEADFDLGMSVNVDGTRALLQTCRAQSAAPVLVFASSLAVFGSDPAVGPVGPVDDDTMPRPQSSYGAEKFIAEQLVAEYSRRGYVRGRSTRLMTVTVRQGKPNAAASSFLSGIIREPLAGEAALCPVPPDTEVALSSPERTTDGLVTAAAATDADWGSRTAMNLPALTTTPALMVDALARVAGPEAADRVEWTTDRRIADIVCSWPAHFSTPRANRLGLRPPASFEEIIRGYLAVHR
jgi:nucleoside-diphosphate-sugar epimerase